MTSQSQKSPMKANVSPHGALCLTESKTNPRLPAFLPIPTPRVLASAPSTCHHLRTTLRFQITDQRRSYRASASPQFCPCQLGPTSFFAQMLSSKHERTSTASNQLRDVPP